MEVLNITNLIQHEPANRSKLKSLNIKKIKPAKYKEALWYRQGIQYKGIDYL